MRLGQLSRRLNISIPKIVTIVKDEFDVTIGEHPNIKLDDSHVELITAKFDQPDQVSENIELLNEETELKITDVPETKVEEVEDSEDNKQSEQQVESKESIIIEETTKAIETIRAKAAKLEGLKVVDKIELPPPPLPEMVEIDGVMYDKAELKKQRIAERKERDANRKKEAAKRAAEKKTRVKKKTVKKEISFAEKRRIEEKKEADIKKTEDKFKRKRQRKHYETKHKKSPLATNKKNKTEPEIIEVEETVIDTRPAPETMLGKFWRWLNTY
jgi:hypothetical protein